VTATHAAEVPMAAARFRLVSYNLLAEIYAGAGGELSVYPYCRHLAWHFRKRNLLSEMLALCGHDTVDIFCLQEVQADSYESWWQPQLADVGYSGVFARKSREAMGSHGKMDGVATFWRNTSFRLRTSTVVEYDITARAFHSDVGDAQGRSTDDLRRLLKGNVGLLLDLEVLDGRGGRHDIGRNLLVGNTHLVSDGKLADVKLFQTAALLKAIAAERASAAESGPVPPAVVLAGDLNSLPQSAVLQLCLLGCMQASNAVLPAELTEAFGAIPGFEESAVAREAVSSAMALGLRSAYQPDPVFTNYTRGFVGTLDWILFAEGSGMELISTLALPGEKDLCRDTALPNSQHSSDHLPIMAEFVLLPTGMQWARRRRKNKIVAPKEGSLERYQQALQAGAEPVTAQSQLQAMFKAAISVTADRDAFGPEAAAEDMGFDQYAEYGDQQHHQHHEHAHHLQPQQQQQWGEHRAEWYAAGGSASLNAEPEADSYQWTPGPASGMLDRTNWQW
jgi:CCR4-NOT transcription complex subunit 6